MSNILVSTAKDYLDWGLSVIPVRDNKEPIDKWQTFQRKAVDSSECDRLFGSAWGIAIIGGAVSDGVELMDFDSHNKDIGSIYSAFMSDKVVASLLTTKQFYVERSMNGGYHVVYKYDCDGKRDGSLKLANWEDGKTMIETRGERGYCIVAPTKGYTCVMGSIELLPRLTDYEREYIIDLARSFTKSVSTSSTKDDDTTSRAICETTDPVSWFNWNKDNYAKKILEEKGWRKIKYDEQSEIEYWQRPGKDDESHSATWGKKHNSLYVFTQSVDYFKARAYYTPFQILVKLKFNDDYNAAIRWIISKYKISKPLEDVMPENKITPNELSFPIDVFPEDIQRFINELNTTLNFSKDFMSIAIMFAFATLNGNKYKLDYKGGWIAPTLFWFAAVGEPGTMKSHPISTILAPIKKIDEMSKVIHDGELAEYEENMLDKKKAKGLKKPKFKQIMISDATLESIHGVHEFNKRGIGYHRDELVGFINSMNQYKSKGSDEQFWLESYNNASYSVNRVSRDTIMIKDTMINIIGTIQPSVLSTIISGHSQNGLSDRFLYTSSEQNIYPLNLNNPDKKYFSWWEKLIREANSHFSYIDQRDTVVINMPVDALKKCVEVDTGVVGVQLSDGTTAAHKSYLSKSKTYLPRFILLMALIDMVCLGVEPEITVDHVLRADKILKYFMQSAQTIFTKARKESEISSVISSVRGLSTEEKVIALHKRGYINSDIAKEVDLSKVRIGQILASHNLKHN